MRRFLLLLILAGLTGGGFYLYRSHNEGFERLLSKLRGSTTSGSDEANETPLVERRTDTIRVASFDVENFGPAKLDNPGVMHVLCDVVRRFDVVAVQEICSPRDDLLPNWIDQINATGRHYDFIAGPRVGRDAPPEQFAYLFDTASVEVDRTKIYTPDDPGHRLTRDPLVASFRVRGPPPEEAFTFTLIDARVEATRTPDELAALADAYRAVRDDGSREDDIIMLGAFYADDRHLGPLGQLPNIMAALSGKSTPTRGAKACDNILFNRLATTEFTGRCGVVDLRRDLKLPTAQAAEVSDHLPVWAEFTILEGGRAGALATRPR